MKNIIAIFIMCIAFALVSLNIGFADTAHEGHGQTHMSTSTAMEHTGSTDTFTHEAVDNHVRAKFQIMSLSSMNMKDPNGATHHVMINLFHDSTNQAIKNAVGKVKLIGPDDKEQTHNLKNYNGIFAVNFTFGKSGKYGVICLVKVDGKKHLYKFWYQHS